MENSLVLTPENRELARKRSGARMVVAGAILISFSAVFVKLSHVSPTVAGFYRVFNGGIGLLIILALKRELPWRGKAIFWLGVLGGIFFALDLFFWHKSVHYIGPGLATILANFQVVLMALCGVVMLGERLRINLILAIPLAMLGLYLLAGVRWDHLGKNYQIGVIFALVAAVCYTGYMMTLRKLQSLPHSPSPMANLAVISFISAGLLGVSAWWHGDSFRIPDMQTLLALSAYGLFSQVIGWILITKGLPHIRSSLAGLLLLLQPSLAFVWDILFFKRPTTAIELVGACLALAAIYMGTTGKAKNR